MLLPYNTVNTGVIVSIALAILDSLTMTAGVTLLTSHYTWSSLGIRMTPYREVLR